MERASFSADQIHHQRRTALLGAALISPFAIVDVLQDGPPGAIALALAARLAWALSLVIGAALLSARVPRVRTADATMSVTTAGAVIVIVVATGGTASGYFAFLLALPFCMVFLLPGHVPSAAASGVAGVAAGALLLARDGALPIELVRWVGTGVGSLTLAVYATHAGGALFRRELEAARAQAAAAAALAESERRRALSERLALVGRLAAGVAHEINNPLGFVKANLAFAREALPDLEAGRRDDAVEVGAALDDAALGVERIRRIVADLGGFAREDSVEPCGTDVAGAVAEALRLASVRTRRIAVLVEVSEELPRVRICRRRLVQVLLNLLVNAADAVEEAGDESRRWIAIVAGYQAGEVSIQVEDGGRGIPASAQARLFEPFFTTKPPGAGTGLGLALSHEYVTAAGGRVSAANGRRGGAVFELHLPLHSGGGGCGGCPRGEPAALPEPPRRASGA